MWAGTAAVAVGVVVGRTAVMGTVVTAGAAWLADGATLGVSDAELLLQARARMGFMVVRSLYLIPAWGSGCQVTRLRRGR